MMVSYNKKCNWFGHDWHVLLYQPSPKRQVCLRCGFIEEDLYIKESKAHRGHNRTK